jgi:hypothetical protein
MWPDGNDACPSVVDSVSSGNCVAAMVFVADGLEIM